MAKSSKKLADLLFPEIKEVSNEILNIPPEERRLHTETYDFSISTIYEYLKNGQIKIPEFQRGYVWNRAQASRLVESLIIQCPIPVLYFSQNLDETFSVIDGNQRLNSIKLFLNDDFNLQGLTTYPELEGFSFSTLDPRFQRHILNRTLRCIIIQKETHPQIKFDVFERLNTGSVKLTPQEIRHGIHRGDLMDLIESLSKNNEWKLVTGTKNDKRMKSEELILRFFALHEKLNIYTNPFITFLNKYSEDNTTLSQEQKIYLTDLFNKTFSQVRELLGDKTFKVFESPGKISKFNTALYDAEMVGLAIANLSEDQIKAINKDNLVAKLSDLIQEDNFNKYITAATTNTNAVKNRINKFKELLLELV